MSTDAASAAAAAASALKLFPLNAFVLGVWFHSMYTCLFFITLWAILFRSKRSPRNVTWVVLTVTMYTLATIYCALVWGYYANALEFHGTTPDLVNILAHDPAWFKGFGMTVFSLNILIADFLFIWRCWVVWEHRWYVVVIPICGAIIGQVLNIITTVGQVEVTESLAPGAVTLHFATFAVPYFSLSLATSLLTTGLIAVRIIMIQRDMRKVGMDTQNGYSKVLEILVESAALYSANLLVFVVLIALRTTKLDYPQDIMPQIAGIAPTLIICRVALGHSRPDAEWSRRGNGAGTGTGIVFTSVGEMASAQTASGTGSGSSASAARAGNKSFLPVFVRSVTTSTDFSASQLGSKASGSDLEEGYEKGEAV